METPNVGMTGEVIGRNERIASTARWVGAGAIAGVAAGIIAGVAARLAMRAFAVGVDHSVAFTIEGTLVILVVGAVLGSTIGVLYAAVRRVVRGPSVLVGPAFALVIFVALFIPALVGGLDEARPDPRLGGILFLAVAVVLGLALAFVEPWSQRLMSRGGPVAVGFAALASVGAALGGVLLVQVTVETWAEFLEVAVP